MAKGTQRRIQPDLLDEIDQYSGSSFSEKMVKWKNDVDTLSHEEVESVVKDLLNRTYVNHDQELEVQR